MRKYYVVIYEERTNKITFPIKAAKNEFDGRTQFAGGYPALFGGTAQGAFDVTLTNELAEESRRTLDSTGPFVEFFQGEPPNDEMVSYWTSTWSPTGAPWGPASSAKEGEMTAIVTVSIDSFTEKDSPRTILDKLVRLTGAAGGSEEQKAEFFDSETAAALVQFIFDHVRLDDGEEE